MINATVFYPVKYKGMTQVACIDFDDWMKIKDKNQYPSPYRHDKSKWRMAYRNSRKVGGRGLVHRLITNCPEGMYVDHINGNGLDNRQSNIRITTLQQNNQNVAPRKDASSKYRGVSYNPINKNWRARVGGHNVGSFKSEDDAAEAYNKKALELFGQYANLNKIGERL